MFQGEDPIVDEVINAMQIWLESKMNRITANLGQAVGMKLSRAAFVVLIKMGGKRTIFNDLKDEFELQLVHVVKEPAQERKKQLKQLILDIPDSKDILEEWSNAFKMRKWFNSIKMTIAEDVKDEIPSKEG